MNTQDTHMVTVITATTPVCGSRPRKAPAAPRYSCDNSPCWCCIGEHGADASISPRRNQVHVVPKRIALRCEVTTPVNSPAPKREIIQRCDKPRDECGVFCRFDSQALYPYPDIPGECPLCHSTGIQYMLKDVFDAEPDHSKHIWLTWEEFIASVPTPSWVIGHLANLDWNDADSSWSHEEDAEEEPEEEEEVDEEEDLYDNYNGEHGDYPCND